MKLQEEKKNYCIVFARFGTPMEFLSSMCIYRKDEIKKLGGEIMEKKFLFRFLGKMPRGKFEFLCVCGEQNFGLRIPADTKQDARLEFTCKKYKAKIITWEQSDHWHLEIIPATEEVKIRR